MTTENNDNVSALLLTAQQAAKLLLTAREAAKSLSVCERTLYELTRSGQIPVVRIGRSVRYSVDDLKKWIQKRSGKKTENSY
jgi:excisionase family DNA binding protein